MSYGPLDDDDDDFLDDVLVDVVDAVLVFIWIYLDLF